VRRAQDGSQEAIESLYRAHWARSRRAAYLIVHDAAASEDIAQEAFLAAVRALDRFDRRRPFGPWLHRIVVNRAIDWARRRALRAEVGVDPENAGSETAAVAPSPSEIGKLLGLPRGTVNSRLRRALDALGGLLGDEA